MMRLPTRSTRTDTLCPYRTLFRSERVDQHQQLHEVLGRRRAGRLHDEHVLAAHVFLDLDLDLAVGERRDQRLARPHAELAAHGQCQRPVRRSEEHTSELQSLMRISYAVFCLKKKNITPSSYD